MQLDFLPILANWSACLLETRALPASGALDGLHKLASSQLSFTQIGKLDRALTVAMGDPSACAKYPRVRLAILGSATISHLPPAIRVAALRRGLIVDVYEGHYGMYLQELMDRSSGLHAFRPDVVLIALDAHHVAEMPGSSAEQTLTIVQQCWTLAKQHLACMVIQQTVLPVFTPELGNNEQRLPTSSASVIEQLNKALRPAADCAGVELLALDVFSRPQGLAAWYDAALWHKSKHEVHPRACMLYGDQVARLLAAGRGMSSKCLVLDLDNTLWGGVIGDDGIEGIVLGQGSALGEAHVAFQRYCSSLAARGIILAICSKNDEGNARLPFNKHPDMILHESDIACFVANWQDKASNLRHIAKTLNIGIDSLVFADDNPAERALIRQELPEVHVPELPADPALYAEMIAQAGYFEGVRVTAEDQERGRQYQANAERARMFEQVTDMETYLQSLDMSFIARPVDEMSLARVTQLINKTNQFNLTTRRYTEAEVKEAINNPKFIVIQVRLTDRFGDNGIIAVLIARETSVGAAQIEVWLMSCRVLGRRVEEACLNVLVDACGERGIERLTGIYRPTEKNNMVRDLYPRLSFSKDEQHSTADEQRYSLDLVHYQPYGVPMTIHNLMAENPTSLELHATA